MSKVIKSTDIEPRTWVKVAGEWIYIDYVVASCDRFGKWEVCITNDGRETTYVLPDEVEASTTRP